MRITSDMKVWLSVCVLVTFFSRISTADDLKLPSYVDVCYRDDPNVSECLKKTITKLLPLFRKGADEFNLDPLDPMVIPYLKFAFPSSIVGGEFTLKNIKINGLTTAKILDIRPKVNDEKKKFSLDFDAFIDLLGVLTPYSLNGNVLSAPVKMSGNADLRFGGLNLTYHIEGDIKTIGDYEYLILKKFAWRFLGEGIKTGELANAESVVTGRPTLSRLIGTIFKSSWKILKDLVLRAILPKIDKTFTETFVKFFKSYPYDTLFPKKGKSKPRNLL